MLPRQSCIHQHYFPLHCVSSQVGGINLREEIRHRARSHESKQHEHQDICLDISESEFQPLEEVLVATVDPVVFTDVFFQPPDSQFAFFIGEPLV